MPVEQLAPLATQALGMVACGHQTDRAAPAPSVTDAAACQLTSRQAGEMLTMGSAPVAALAAGQHLHIRVRRKGEAGSHLHLLTCAPTTPRLSWEG